MQIPRPQPRPGEQDSGDWFRPGFPGESSEHLHLSATDPVVRDQEPHHEKCYARLFKWFSATWHNQDATL